MYNKEELKQAVKHFSGYSKKYCEVFDALIDISSDCALIVNAKLLCEHSNIKRSTLYFAIHRFQVDGLIHKEPRKSTQVVFQKDKLDHYLELSKNFKKKIIK